MDSYCRGLRSVDLVVAHDEIVILVFFRCSVPAVFYLLVHVIDVNSIDARYAGANLVPLCHPALRRHHDGDHTYEVLGALRAVIAVGALLDLPPLILVHDYLAVDTS